MLASHATVHYTRPAIELYGTEGTANLLGDDWDPQGIELWREDQQTWTVREPDDATWMWSDGLREAVAALCADRAALADPGAVRCVEVFMAIETEGRWTRGATVVDLRGRLRRKPNARVAVELDVERFWDLVVDAVDRLGRDAA